MYTYCINILFSCLFFIEKNHHHQSSLLYKFKLFCITYNRNQHSVIVLKCESQNTVLIIVKYNSPFDVLLHEITDAPPKNTTFLARPTAYYQSPMLILFLISFLTSSILSGYVLSQLLSLLRSCVIKYNTGTYQHTYTGCDAERYRWRLSTQTGLPCQ